MSQQKIIRPLLKMLCILLLYTVYYCTGKIYCRVSLDLVRSLSSYYPDLPLLLQQYFAIFDSARTLSPSQRIAHLACFLAIYEA